jgi:molybdopterin synthase sulfur carrier subunit
MEVSGITVRQALEAVFAANPAVRSYLLDDQGGVRKHMSIFVGGEQLRDRQRQSDPVAPDAEIFIMQALSGG